MGAVIAPQDWKGKLKKSYDTYQSFIIYMKWSIWGSKGRQNS